MKPKITHQEGPDYQSDLARQLLQRHRLCLNVKLLVAILKGTYLEVLFHPECRQFPVIIGVSSLSKFWIHKSQGKSYFFAHESNYLPDFREIPAIPDRLKSTTV
jgi:hypothetical protein